MFSTSPVSYSPAPQMSIPWMSLVFFSLEIAPSSTSGHASRTYTGQTVPQRVEIPLEFILG